MAVTSRAEIESLLRARKLDGTLTTAAPWRETAPDNLASTGVDAIDAALGGGLRRGNLSEVVGVRSTGRTTVLCQALIAAVARGEVVALVDACDRFDPASAAAAGLDLSRLLWVRDTGDALRALKALNLVLQAGGFGVVAFDVADVPAAALRAFPLTTWARIARVIEGSQTVALLIGTERVARSPGGVTIALDAPSTTWAGSSDRAWCLHGFEIRPRIVGGYASRTGPSCAFHPTTT